MKPQKIVLPNLCQFPFADGRSCRMPVSRNHDYLCVFHADRERRLFDLQGLDSGDLSDLFGPSGELRTNTDINSYITRIAKYAVAGRISPKILPSLIYAAALLLRSVPGIQSEFIRAYNHETWYAELRRLFSARGVHQKQPQIQPSNDHAQSA